MLNYVLNLAYKQFPLMILLSQADFKLWDLGQFMPTKDLALVVAISILDNSVFQVHNIVFNAVFI